MLGDSELREYQFDEEGTEIADPLIALAQPDSILISRIFAEKHNLKDGDKLPLFTSQGRKDFIVRGSSSLPGLKSSAGRLRLWMSSTCSSSSIAEEISTA
ncbi:MAG: hypothetical protein IPL01_03160 [Acidobacteria bacterium]|nr:hypothetical protein [Acidobacteriota bacterium]